MIKSREISKTVKEGTSVPTDRRSSVFPVIAVLLLFTCLLVIGCGTTKWSDTSRTGTEQLLLSYAIDHAVEQLNFNALARKKVFVESKAIDGVTDSKYICTTIRQHIASSGGLLCDKQEDAEFIVELRAGAVGTDRNDLMIGIPAITVPVATTNGTLPQIPEIPFVKRTDQRAVAKIAVFVYNRESGRPLWCSGNRQSESRAKAWWVFGAGPINRGSIYDGTEFAGSRLPTMIAGESDNLDPPPLATERFFPDNKEKPEEKPQVAQNDAPVPPTSTSDPTPAPTPNPTPAPAPAPASGPTSIQAENAPTEKDVPLPSAPTPRLSEYGRPSNI